MTRFNRAAVKSGQVDPSEVIKFLKRGVRVYNYDTLHAKVYVFGQRGFVGSANVSRSSQALAEACLETTDKTVLAEARAFIDSLTGDLITIEYAKSLSSLYPRDGERFYGAPGTGGSKGKNQSRSKVWVVPSTFVAWPDAVEKANVVGKKVAATKVADPTTNKLDQGYAYKNFGIAPGDWVVWRADKGRGFEFECPGRVVHIEAVPRSSQVLLYTERPKRAKDISSSEVRETLPSAVKATTFSSFNPRLIVASETAANFLKLWAAFRG